MKLKLLASFLLTTDAVVKQTPRNSWFQLSEGETAYTQVPESYKWKDLVRSTYATEILIC